MMEQPDVSESLTIEHRKSEIDLLPLVEVEPFDVVDGIRVADGYLTGDIVISGAMRELCPECKTEHLKLVLRQEHVKRTHMFCESCTRCFDARYPDGTPALVLA
jgi:hypothetical protein